LSSISRKFLDKRPSCPCSAHPKYVWHKCTSCEWNMCNIGHVSEICVTYVMWVKYVWHTSCEWNMCDIRHVSKIFVTYMSCEWNLCDIRNVSEICVTNIMWVKYVWHSYVMWVKYVWHTSYEWNKCDIHVRHVSEIVAVNDPIVQLL